jgi:hypothetical protein
MDRSVIKNNTAGLLWEIARNTTDSNTVARIVNRITSVKPIERSKEDFEVLHAALANSAIRRDTLEVAKAKEELHTGTERDVIACGLIETHLRTILRTEKSRPSVFGAMHELLDEMGNG